MISVGCKTNVPCEKDYFKGTRILRINWMDVPVSAYATADWSFDAPIQVSTYVKIGNLSTTMNK